MYYGACRTIGTFSAYAASEFDPVYYAAAYPDVAAAVGTEPEALWNHYLAYGMAEGRCPYAGAQPGETVSGISGAVPGAAVSSVLNVPVEVKEATFSFVSVYELANLQSIRKRMTDAELNAAYQAALMIAAPYVDCTREE